LENKFAPLPLTIPLDSDIERSLSEVYKVTSKLRSSFGDVYATYAATFYIGMFAPYKVMEKFSEYSTRPFTLAFSNLPGLIKPIYLDGRKSLKMQHYLIPGGVTGMALSLLSYVDFFKIGLVVDDTIMTDPQTLVDLIEANLNKVIKLAADATAKPK